MTDVDCPDCNTRMYVRTAIQCPGCGGTVHLLPPSYSYNIKQENAEHKLRDDAE